MPSGSALSSSVDPQGVSRAQDQLYRFPVLAVTAGDIVISDAPPAHVKELVVTMYTTGNAKVLLTLWDSTWVTIPALLAQAYLSGQKSNKKASLTLTFGWNIAGQLMQDATVELGMILTKVQPEGVEYQITGNLTAGNSSGGQSVLNEAHNFSGTLNQVVYDVIKAGWGEDAAKRAIIEPTANRGGDFTIKYLATWLHGWAAENAAPINAHSKMPDFPDISEEQLDTYVAYIDHSGIWHFHSFGYELSLPPSQRDAIPNFFYPYSPREAQQVISLSFADLNWGVAGTIGSATDIAPLTIQALRVNEITGDLMEVVGPAEQSAIGFKQKVPMAKATPNQDFADLAAKMQRQLSGRPVGVDVTIMGNVNLQPGRPMQITVQPPPLIGETELSTYLSGYYLIKSVVHTVSEGGFVTALTGMRSDTQKANIGTDFKPLISNAGSNDPASDNSGGASDNSGGSDLPKNKPITDKQKPKVEPPPTLTERKGKITKVTLAMDNMIAQGYDHDMKQGYELLKADIDNGGSTDNIGYIGLTPDQFIDWTAAIMTIESVGGTLGAGPEVRSPTGARGLMQLTGIHKTAFNKVWNRYKSTTGIDYWSNGWKNPLLNIGYAQWLLNETIGYGKNYGVPVTDSKGRAALLQWSAAAYNSAPSGVDKVYKAELDSYVEFKLYKKESDPNSRADGWVYRVTTGAGGDIDKIDRACDKGSFYSRQVMQYYKFFQETAGSKWTRGAA